MAAEYKKRSEDILEDCDLAINKKYIEWLQKWDALLINYVLQPLPANPNPHLKDLIRSSIPHAYRSRVWKRFVNFFVYCFIKIYY